MGQRVQGSKIRFVYSLFTLMVSSLEEMTIVLEAPKAFQVNEFGYITFAPFFLTISESSSIRLFVNVIPVGMNTNYILLNIRCS